MSENKNNNFLMQGSILAIAGLITRLIGMLYRIPLTRIVGSEGMGYYNIAYEIYNITLLVSTYSLPVAVSKLISARDKKGEYRNSYQVFKIAMVMASIIGAVFSVLLFVFSDFLATAIRWPSAAVPLRVLAPTIFVFSVMGIIRGLFQGKRTMVPTAVSQIVEQIINAIVSIVAAVLLINAYKDTAEVAARGAEGGTWGTFIGACAGLVFLVLIYFKNRSSFRKDALSDTTGNKESNALIVKAVFLTMLPIILNQVIYQISGIIDNSMFGTIMNEKGYDETARSIMYEAYSNKYKWLYNVPVAIASAFGVSIVPSLSANAADRDFAAIRNKIASSIKLNMIVAIPAAVGLGVLARPILLLIFNMPDDVLSPRLMTLGCAAVVFFAYSTLTNGILQGINHMRIPVRHAAISLVLHIGLLYVLISVFDLGAYGLVIGNVTYGLVICVLNWISIAKITEYRQEIKTTFVIPLVSASLMGVTAFGVCALCERVIGSAKISAVFGIVIAVAVYFVALIALRGLSADEIKGLPKGNLIYRVCKKLHLVK